MTEEEAKTLERLPEGTGPIIEMIQGPLKGCVILLNGVPILHLKRTTPEESFADFPCNVRGVGL